MALVAFLLAFGALCLQGSADVTPVFVQKGDDVLLKVNEYVELNEETDFFWKFNKLYSIVKLSHTGKPVTFRNYSGRVEFSVENHSLLLKNLQHADSGYYAALVTGAKDRNIAEYKVTVQNPVSPVKLSVDAVSSRVDSCNLTVNCSARDINRNYRCDTKNCNPEGNEQPVVIPSGSSLHVYVLNNSIICNHSNEVSWIEDLKEIQPLCHLAAPNLGQPIAIGIGIPVFLLLCGLFII